MSRWRPGNDPRPICGQFPDEVRFCRQCGTAQTLAHRARLGADMETTTSEGARSSGVANLTVAVVAKEPTHTIPSPLAKAP
jgi:hypothetical protein